MKKILNEPKIRNHIKSKLGFETVEGCEFSVLDVNNTKCCNMIDPDRLQPNQLER